jgi:STE24 endopeptidase
VAIIAHELGHHKNNDNLKLLVLATIKLGIMFFLYSVVLNNEDILISFGFDHKSNFVSLMLFFKLYESLGFIMNKMTNQYIRKIEYQADSYAAHTDFGGNYYRKPLSEAIIKIFKENRSSLHPDSLFSAMYNTHPTMMERLRRIGFNPYEKNYVIKR